MTGCEQEPEQGALPSDGSVERGERFRNLPQQAADVFRGSFAASDLQDRLSSFSDDCREAKIAFGAVLNTGSVAQQECLDIHTQALNLIGEIYDWADSYVSDLINGDNGPPGQVVMQELELYANKYDTLVRRRDAILTQTRRTPSQTESVGTGGDSDATTGADKLTAVQAKAYRSYLQAVKANSDLADAKDKDVYEWLKQRGCEEYEGIRFPSFETWQRYVRAGRKCYGTQKNRSRAGRPTGKSIVTPDQL
jgi:hypothetical protein